MFQQLVVNFADFWRNISIFMQKSHTFKKFHLSGKFCISTISGKKNRAFKIYQSQKKFIFRLREENFADYERNNNY